MTRCILMIFAALASAAFGFTRARGDVPAGSPSHEVAQRPSRGFFNSDDRAVRESSLPEDLKRRILAIHQQARSEMNEALSTAATRPATAARAAAVSRLVQIESRAHRDVDILLTEARRTELQRLKMIAGGETAFDGYQQILSHGNLTPDQQTQAAAVLTEARARLHQTGRPDLVDTRNRLLAILTDEQKRSPELAPLELMANLAAPERQTAEARQRTLAAIQNIMLNNFERQLKKIELSEEQKSQVTRILQDGRSQARADRQVVYVVAEKLSAVLTDEQKRLPEARVLLIRPPATRPAGVVS